MNVLAADQVGVCRAMSAKGADRFRDLSWQPAGTGAPVIDGIVAWIDCTMANVVEAGDHLIALGAVQDLQVVSTKLPLLFFRGGYGAFEPQTNRLTELTEWSIGWG